MMNTINNSQPLNYISKVNFKQTMASVAPKTEIPTDKVDVSETKQRPEPPEISRTRLFFSRLTDDQIKQVNESGKLPKNAKFVMNGMGYYAIANNFFNFRVGTQELPAGFEVKKDIFGFTVVLPKGMEGLSVKSVK